MRRSAKTVGVVSDSESKTLMMPLFSATKTRPSGGEGDRGRLEQAGEDDRVVESGGDDRPARAGAAAACPPVSSGWRNISGPSVGAGVGSTARSGPGAASIDPRTIAARIADRRRRADGVACDVPCHFAKCSTDELTSEQQFGQPGHKS